MLDGGDIPQNEHVQVYTGLCAPVVAPNYEKGFWEPQHTAESWGIRGGGFLYLPFALSTCVVGLSSQLSGDWNGVVRRGYLAVAH